MKTPHRYSAGLGLYECAETGFEICPHKKHLPVQILPEFRDLITPLGEQERDGLKESLKTEGVRDPLVIGWIAQNEYVLLDGHNRFEIERLHDDGAEFGISAAYKIFEFSDREAAKLWILENQVSRRNLTDDQRAIIWNDIRERRSTAIRAAQLEAARESAVSVNLPETDPGLSKITPIDSAIRKTDTRVAVAKEAKLPERKLRTAQEIKKASPELAAKVRAGEMTLKQAKQALRPVQPSAPEIPAVPPELQESDDFAAALQALEDKFPGAIRLIQTKGAVIVTDGKVDLKYFSLDPEPPTPVVTADSSPVVRNIIKKTKKWLKRCNSGRLSTADSLTLLQAEAKTAQGIKCAETKNYVLQVIENARVRVNNWARIEPLITAPFVDREEELPPLTLAAPYVEPPRESGN